MTNRVEIRASYKLSDDGKSLIFKVAKYEIENGENGNGFISSKAYLSQRGEWVGMAEGQNIPEDCLFPLMVAEFGL